MFPKVCEFLVFLGCVLIVFKLHQQLALSSGNNSTKMGTTLFDIEKLSERADFGPLQEVEISNGNRNHQANLKHQSCSSNPNNCKICSRTKTRHVALNGTHVSSQTNTASKKDNTQLWHGRLAQELARQNLLGGDLITKQEIYEHCILAIGKANRLNFQSTSTHK